MTFSFDWCRVLLYGLVFARIASTGHSTGCECLVCCKRWEELWGSWDSALYCLASQISQFSLKSPTTCSSFQTGRSHRSHRSHQDVNEGNLATPKSPGQREVPLDATCPGMIGWQSGIRKGSVSVCQLPKLPCLSVLQQVRFLRQNSAHMDFQCADCIPYRRWTPKKKGASHFDLGANLGELFPLRLCSVVSTWNLQLFPTFDVFENEAWPFHTRHHRFGDTRRLPFFAPMTCLYFSQSGGIAERTVLPAKKVARDSRGEGSKGYLQLNENSMRWEKTRRGKAHEAPHDRAR